jgi:hypothetical protein
MGDSLRVAARVAVWVVAVGLCAALGAGLAAQAQTQVQGVGAETKTMLMEPPTPLLPATLGKLQRVAAGDAGDGLGAVDAADAPVLTEDGLRRFARSDYADGTQRVDVTVYRFVDASGAISAYDYLRKPGVRPEKLGDDALWNGDELLLRSGANVVVESFKGDGALLSPLTHELIDHLPKVGGPAGIAPLLPTLLPEKGIDAESVRYALGPAGYGAMGGVLPAEMVGFDKNAEAVTAKSKEGGVLTMLLYPTPEIAGEHQRAIEALSRQPGTSLTGTVKMRREGPLLLLTSGAWPEAEAQKMVDGIHLRSEVTWNKPVPLDFETELHKTFSLLESIVIFCAFSALAMLVLGVFLGGGRALVRVMQGKPAATEPEFLRIDLSGPVGKHLGEPKD